MYCLELKAVFLAVQYWFIIVRPPGFDCYRHYILVVSYINKQGGGHVPCCVRQWVYLIVAGQTQPSIKSQTNTGPHECDSALVVSAGLSSEHRVESPPPSSSPGIQSVRIPTVDMFAMIYNTQLPQFVSLIPEDKALAVNALCLTGRENGCTRFPLLSRNSQKLKSTQAAKVILLAVWWPSQPLLHLNQFCVD